MTLGSSPEPRGAWGVVLAGAYLTGRSLFERLRPRPLLPVAQRPIISYALRWLSDAGVAGVTVCLNGASGGVRRAVEAETDLHCAVDFREDATPRGTAGIARDAAHVTSAKTFLVVNATAMPEIEPQALMAFHRANGATVTVLGRREPGPAAAGSGLSPVGVYVFDRRALGYVPAQGFQDIKETLLPRLHGTGEDIVTFETEGPGIRVVDTETYLTANERLIPRAVEGDVPAGFFRCGQGLVHASARVSPRARLVGPVILGPGASIEAGATVVGPTAIGTGSGVGPSAVVSRSVLWDACAVGAGALVDRCLVADGGLVPEGAQLYGALRAGPGRTRRQAGRAAAGAFDEGAVPAAAASAAVRAPTRPA